jgi:hypothetical protein
MAKRKHLKQRVNDICAILAQQWFMAVVTTVKQGDEAAQPLMDIDALQREFISRISHTPREGAKAYYRAFYNDFNERLNKLYDAIDKLAGTADDKKNEASDL